jgi:N-acetylglucosamine kinase-like BadF-type ATPase
MNGAWLFGIDGGGTASRLRIESLSGEKLFYAEGEGTNLNSRPAAAVAETLASLFDGAYAALPELKPELCAAGHSGSAGADRAADRELFLRLLRGASRAPSDCPLSVGNDAETALVGALGDTEGLLLIAGTGSIAYGRTRAGRCVRAGGWGHLLGDEGSAYAIALGAISRAIRSAEGRDKATGLLPAALRYFGASEIADLVPLFYRDFDKARIAGFSREVARERDSGDGVAAEIFAEAAEDLALLALSVYDRLKPELARPRLALSGGLIQGDGRLKEALKARLAALRPAIELVPSIADAATGACALARELLRNA